MKIKQYITTILMAKMTLNLGSYIEGTYGLLSINISKVLFRDMAILLAASVEVMVLFILVVSYLNYDFLIFIIIIRKKQYENSLNYTHSFNFLRNSYKSHLLNL